MPNAQKDAATERSAFTIAEFCRRNRISEPTYFKLRHLGRGPKEMRLGAAVRISTTAESEWQRAREHPKGEEAEAVRAQQQSMRDRCHAAAGKAVESTKHISRHTTRRGRGETGA